MKLEKAILKKERSEKITEAILYCRVAHDDGVALENQIKALKRYARQQGYGAVGIIAEQGDGLSIMRSGLGRVVEALKKRKAHIVLVTDISRISREPHLAWQFVHFLNNHHITLVSMNGQIDCLMLNRYVRALCLNKTRVSLQDFQTP